MYQSNSKVEKYTRKIIKTPDGYIHRSSFHEETNRKYVRNSDSSTFGKDRVKMQKKLKRGIYALLINNANNGIQTREETYDILKDRGFLPVIAENKVLSFSRFVSYYAGIKRDRNIVFNRPTKTSYILANYKTESVASIALNVDSEEIFVRQTISKIKRGLI